MENLNDDFIVGLVKGKVGEVMDRMDRERPELSPEEREEVVVRVGQQEVAIALATRPDLTEHFGANAAEHFFCDRERDSFLAWECAPSLSSEVGITTILNYVVPRHRNSHYIYTCLIWREASDC